jgi:hypothetical protein
VAGVLADRTGSYEFGFTVLACFSGVGSLFFLLARRPPLPPRLRNAITPPLEGEAVPGGS